jgi:hypothetical protein
MKTALEEVARTLHGVLADSTYYPQLKMHEMQEKRVRRAYDIVQDALKEKEKVVESKDERPCRENVRMAFMRLVSGPAHSNLSQIQAEDIILKALGY